MTLQRTHRHTLMYVEYQKFYIVVLSKKQCRFPQQLYCNHYIFELILFWTLSIVLRYVDIENQGIVVWQKNYILKASNFFIKIKMPSKWYLNYTLLLALRPLCLLLYCIACLLTALHYIAFEFGVGIQCYS